MKCGCFVNTFLVKGRSHNSQNCFPREFYAFRHKSSPMPSPRRDSSNFRVDQSWFHFPPVRHKSFPYPVTVLLDIKRAFFPVFISWIFIITVAYIETSRNAILSENLFSIMSVIMRNGSGFGFLLIFFCSAIVAFGQQTVVFKRSFAWRKNLPTDATNDSLIKQQILPKARQHGLKIMPERRLRFLPARRTALLARRIQNQTIECFTNTARPETDLEITVWCWLKTAKSSAAMFRGRMGFELKKPADINQTAQMNFSFIIRANASRRERTGVGRDGIFPAQIYAESAGFRLTFHAKMKFRL